MSSFRSTAVCLLVAAALHLPGCTKPSPSDEAAASATASPAATEPAWVEPTLLQALLDRPGVPNDWRVHLGLMSERDLPDHIGLSNVFDLVPGPNTPDETVLAYWEQKLYQPSGGQLVTPDDEPVSPSLSIDPDSRRRLLDAAVRHPHRLPNVLVLLDADDPATHDRLKKLLDASPASAPAGRPNDVEAWQPKVRTWVMHRSRHYRRELIERAASLRVGEFDRVENESALRALANLDWQAARPVAERQAANADARVAAVALAVLHEGETKAGRAAAAKDARTKLLTMVSDPVTVDSAKTAVRSLIAVLWTGDERQQEEWAVGVLRDPGLAAVEDVQSAMGGDAERWSRVLRPLVGGDDRQMHDRAVETLLTIAPDPTPPEHLRPLLPWLADANWSSAEGRERLPEKLATVDLPEAIPGLIAVLRTAEGPLLAAAAKAVSRNKSPAAVEPLRAALARETDETHREAIVRALLACGAVDDDAAASAIEAYARHVGAAADIPAAPVQSLFAPPAPMPPTVSLGKHLVDFGISDAVAARLAERAEVIRPAEPAVANELFDVLSNSFTASADRYLLRRATAADADEQSVVALASRARGARKRIADDLRRMSAGTGIPAGIAASVLADDAVCRRILEGNDVDAIKGLLATARLSRTLLPVDVVGRRLDGKDGELVAAAKAYLLTEDSPSARAILLARYPGMITGKTEGGPKVLSPTIDALAREVAARRNAGTEEVFALLDGGTDRIVRVRKDGSATLSLVNHLGRIRHRELSPDELAELRRFVTQHRFDDLPPLPYTGVVIDGTFYDYLHLTPAGGRRIAMNNPDDTAPGTPYDRLVRLFTKLEKAGRYQVRYAAADQLPGLRVSVTLPPYGKVHGLWRQGEDLRLLFQANGRQWRNRVDPWTWHGVRDGNLATPVNAPPTRPGPEGWADLPAELTLDDHPDDRSGFASDRSLLQLPGGWSVCLARGPGHWTQRLWKFKVGHPPVLITDDEAEYGPPVVTPDGRWIIATRYEREEDQRIVRIAADTHRQTPVPLPPSVDHRVVAYVAPHARVLIARRLPPPTGAELGTPPAYEHLLLDPATGATQSVTGDLAPLEARWMASRPQPTANPDEFWVAVPPAGSPGLNEATHTRIGRYNAKTFTFTPVLLVPGLEFGNWAMWVDEPRREVLIALDEDVVVAPLPGDGGK